MKRSKHFLFLFVLFIQIGCEDSQIVDVDVGYREYIVVRAELFADSIFSGVTFTKTLPLNSLYDIKKAELKNVFAYLQLNDVQVIPLHYTADGLYKPLYDIKIKSGIKYELFAKVGEKSIYASTLVPEKPRIRNSAFHNNEYVDIFIESKTNECFGSVFYIYGTSSGYLSSSTDFHSIVEAVNSDFNNVLMSRTQEIPAQFRTDLFRSLTYFQVFSFDIAYSDYFKTRGNSEPVTNSFIQGGDKVAWNVKGDGVIGLFIGRNKSAILRVNQ